MGQSAGSDPLKPDLSLSAVERWRLLLGEASQSSLGAGSGRDATVAQMDRALAWLYGRDENPGTSDRLDRHGGTGPT